MSCYQSKCPAPSSIIIVISIPRKCFNEAKQKSDKRKITISSKDRSDLWIRRKRLRTSQRKKFSDSKMIHFYGKNETMETVCPVVRIKCRRYGNQQLCNGNFFNWWGAAIAQWIRSRLPSCRPGFESQAHHLRFFQFEFIEFKL